MSLMSQLCTCKTNSSEVKSRITTQEPIMEKSEFCNKVNSICDWHILALGKRFATICVLKPQLTQTRGYFLLNQQCYQTSRILAVKKNILTQGMRLPRMFCFTYAVLWVTISKATSHKPQVGKDHVHLKAMLLIKSRAIQHQSNPILFFVFYLFTSRAMTWRSRS